LDGSGTSVAGVLVGLKSADSPIVKRNRPVAYS
jgi:hypothetical protein